MVPEWSNFWGGILYSWWIRSVPIITRYFLYFRYNTRGCAVFFLVLNLVTNKEVVVACLWNLIESTTIDKILIADIRLLLILNFEGYFYFAKTNFSTILDKRLVLDVLPYCWHSINKVPTTRIFFF